MQLTELFELIQSTLGRQGFKLTPLLRNSMTCSHFILSDNDIYQKSISCGTSSSNAFFGNWLEVREVSRRNGAKYNTSYYLEIEDCERSTSHAVKKLKLKCDQTEATLTKKIINFALEYKAYVEDKLLEAKIDEYINNRWAR